MLQQWILAATVIVGSSAMAADYQPRFDPSHLKGPATGTPNEVLVLGTPHLREMPAGFTPQSLELLLNRLAAWKPQIITIESLSGSQCDFMRRYITRYGEGTLKRYCADPSAARKATGLDVPKATAKMDQIMAKWPAAPTAAQRRHLASVFLAAGDPTSALVQWLRLPAQEQRVGDGLDKALVAFLKTQTGKRDEASLIAAPLAARLGLERIYPTDDFTSESDGGDESDGKASGEVMQRLWDNPATAKRSADTKVLYTQVQSGEGILAMYRAVNQPDYAQLVWESDFGAAMKDTSGKQYGRSYVTYWERRNLRMVSNIRDVLGIAPGKRLLTIVGASHKGYFEAYLNMMHDVKLVDSQEVLR